MSSARAKRKRYVTPNSNKKRGNYASSVDPTKGIRAVIVTCDRGKEKDCASEMIEWMNTAADDMTHQRDADTAVTATKDDDDDNGDDDDDVDVSAALAKEIAHIRSEREYERTHCDTVLHSTICR